jgi:hypothetical protein
VVSATNSYGPYSQISNPITRFIDPHFDARTRDCQMLSLPDLEVVRDPMCWRGRMNVPVAGEHGTCNLYAIRTELIEFCQQLN